jgi:hypothetical protein
LCREEAEKEGCEALDHEEYEKATLIYDQNEIRGV